MLDQNWQPLSWKIKTDLSLRDLSNAYFHWEQVFQLETQKIDLWIGWSLTRRTSSKREDSGMAKPAMTAHPSTSPLIPLDSKCWNFHSRLVLLPVRYHDNSEASFSWEPGWSIFSFQRVYWKEKLPTRRATSSWLEMKWTSTLHLLSLTSISSGPIYWMPVLWNDRMTVLNFHGIKCDNILLFTFNGLK